MEKSSSFKRMRMVSLWQFLEVMLHGNLNSWLRPFWINSTDWICVTTATEHKGYELHLNSNCVHLFSTSHCVSLHGSHTERTQASLAWAASGFVCIMKEKALCVVMSGVCVCVIVSLLGCGAPGLIWVRNLTVRNLTFVGTVTIFLLFFNLLSFSWVWIRVTTYIDHRDFFVSLVRHYSVQYFVFIIYFCRINYTLFGNSNFKMCSSLYRKAVKHLHWFNWLAP